jgi:hypothetical protein
MLIFVNVFYNYILLIFKKNTFINDLIITQFFNTNLNVLNYEKLLDSRGCPSD